MAQGWYPAARRNDAPVNGGSFLRGVPARGVLHTTEALWFHPEEGTYYGHSSYPHFTVETDGTVWQHIPVTVAARALKNLAGGVQTNRMGAIQIEVCAKASRPKSWPAAQVDAVRALMRWIESERGVKRVAAAPFVAYPDSYGQRASQRMGFTEWETFDGWCGHQHVPENDHGDPGRIDIAALLAAPTQEDEVTPQDIDAIADAVVSKLGLKGRNVGNDLAVLRKAVRAVAAKLGITTRYPADDRVDA